MSLSLSLSLLVCGKPLGLCVLKGLKQDATYGISMATFRKQTPSRATLNVLVYARACVSVYVRYRSGENNCVWIHICMHLFVFVTENKCILK